MILINLLPHRAERRRQRKRAFFVGLGAAAGAGVLVAAGWTLVLQQLTQVQQTRNGYLRAEITRLDGQIKDIANLKAEIEGLKARQAAVEDLQVNRNLPVHLLDELVKQTPEGIYLTAIRQTDSSVLLSGLAQTNERVSELLRNAQNNSKWLDKLELVEIKAVNLPPTVGSREQRRLYEFSLRMNIKLPEAPAAPASAPGASAPKAA